VNKRLAFIDCNPISSAGQPFVLLQQCLNYLSRPSPLGRGGASVRWQISPERLIRCNCRVLTNDLEQRAALPKWLAQRISNGFGGCAERFRGRASELSKSTAQAIVTHGTHIRTGMT
jgi:hypothetical protein